MFLVLHHRLLLIGKTPEFSLLMNFHARISARTPNALRHKLSMTVRPMPLSGTTYDPDTLAMLYRALDAAIHRAVSDVDILNEALRQSVRERLARPLIRAYEDGERDPELLTIIAVQSYQRDV
jgi:hypothetical protein